MNDVRDASVDARRQADAFADLGRWEDALARYVDAFATDSTDSYSACRIVDALTALRRTDDAIAAAERAVEHFPEHAPAFNALGNVASAAGRGVAAVAAFERAIELEPNAAYLHRNLARAAWKVPDFPTAVAAARRGLELAPQDARSFQALGYVLLQAGEPAEAAQWLQRGLGINPESTVMMNNLGRAYAAAGDLDAAADTLRDVMRIRPQDDETSRELLSVMVRQQSAAGGRTTAREVVRQYVGFFRRLDLDAGVADHVVASSLRAGSDLLADLGDLAGALEIALDAVTHADEVAAGGRTRFHGTAVACRCAAARLASRLGRHEQAVELATEAVDRARLAAELHPIDDASRVPQALYQLAQSLGAAGQVQDAAATAADCVAASRALPDGEATRRHWLRWSLCVSSDRLAAAGRGNEAIAACTEAVDVARETWEERGAGEQRRAYADELGHLADHLLAADRPTEALVHVELAIEHYREIVDDRPEHRCWLDEKLLTAGACLARLGQRDAARAVLDEALASLEASRAAAMAVSTQDQSTTGADQHDVWITRARALLADLSTDP